MPSITDDGRECTKCGEFKPWGEFSSHPKGPRRKHPSCKVCVNRAAREHAQLLKQRSEIESPAFKRCNRCGETKPGTEFTRSAERADGLVSRCRTCCRRPPIKAKPPEYTEKPCSQCRAVQPLSAYHRARCSTDGCSPICKRCRRAAAGLVEESNRVRWAAGLTPPDDGLKRCGKCGLELPKTDFTRAARCKDGLNWCCRACWKRHYDENQAVILERHREYFRQNQQRLTAANQAWARANPERIKMYEERRRVLKLNVGAGFTFDEWQEMKARYDYRCLRCGRQEPEIALEMDHVLPLAQGGPHEASNIQPLCRSCNAQKHKQATDYRPRQD